LERTLHKNYTFLFKNLKTAQDLESEMDKAIEGKRDVQVGEGRTERTSILFTESLFRERASCVLRPESDTGIQS